jgi:hypothetical protein
MDVAVCVGADEFLLPVVFMQLVSGIPKSGWLLGSAYSAL